VLNPQQQVWQDGGRVVMARDGELPQICVQCGQPGVEQLPRKLNWTSRWLLLFVLGGVVLYAIAASIAAKRSRVLIWLCATHAEARRRNVKVGWIGLGLIGLSFVGLFFGGSIIPRALLGALAIIEVLLLVGGSVVGLYGYYRSRLVGAARIDGTHVWVSGVGAVLRNSLPQFAP
jgi:hypothetical protein